VNDSNKAVDNTENTKEAASEEKRTSASSLLNRKTSDNAARARALTAIDKLKRSKLIGVFAFKQKREDIVAIESGEKIERAGKVSDQLRIRNTNRLRTIIDKKAAVISKDVKQKRMWAQVASVVKIMRALRPQSKWRTYWEYLLLLVCVYLWVEVSFRSAFSLQPDIMWWIIDAAFDLVLWVDIWQNFVMSYEAAGELIIDRRKIRAHYLRTFAAWDFVASIPFDLLAVIPGVPYSPMMRLNRLVRMVRIDFYFGVIEERTTLNPSAVRIMKSSFFLAMMAHFIACLYNVVIVNQPNGGSQQFAGGSSNFEDLPLASRYVRSVYWAVVSLTGALNTDPGTMVEYAFYYLVSLVGVMLYVALIGTVASLVSKLDSAGEFHREKMDGLHDFMRYRKLPVDMQQRVRDYYTYLWASRKGLDESEVMNDLPEYLRVDIALTLNKDIIEKVPLFQNQSEHFIAAVVSRMRPRVVLPGYMIIRKGEIGKEMFFLARGDVQVVSEDGGQIYARLAEGSFFGEVALLISNKRTASVRAAAYCDLFVLAKDDFDQVLSEFPDESRVMLDEARRRYNFQQRTANAAVKRDSSSS
jgi:hypothetical protein